MSVWFQMTIELFSEWMDVAHFGSVQKILGNCFREYINVLEQMGCKYVEQMLDHCNEGEHSI